MTEVVERMADRGVWGGIRFPLCLFHALVALACQSLDHDRYGLKIVG
ncbi:hypothetical protein SAMN05443582_102306 [Phyllobacterium sp. OV277]|nr:hypothetical protein SAMN05443582_102306 [Phyllobacterium sp. OV277]